MNVNVFESFSDSSVYRILSRCLARLLHGLSSCKHCGILKIFELLYIFFYFLLWYFTLHLFWLYLCAPEYCTLCMELFWHMQHTTSTCYTNFMVSLRLASHLILWPHFLRGSLHWVTFMDGQPFKNNQHVRPFIIHYNNLLATCEVLCRNEAHVLHNIFLHQIVPAYNMQHFTCRLHVMSMLCRKIQFWGNGQKMTYRVKQDVLWVWIKLYDIIITSSKEVIFMKTCCILVCLNCIIVKDPE